MTFEISADLEPITQKAEEAVRGQQACWEIMARKSWKHDDGSGGVGGGLQERSCLSWRANTTPILWLCGVPAQFKTLLGL